MQTSALVNQMKSNSKNISNFQVTEKTYSKLNHAIQAQDNNNEESKYLITITLDELMESLQAHDIRVDEKSQIKVEEAIQSQLRVYLLVFLLEVVFVEYFF